MIEVTSLRKDYGEIRAVDGVTFSAEPGKIFGLLGPNGAGKTTTINVISGLLKPTAGHVKVQGHDVVSDGKAARRSLGIVPQEIAVYEEVSATENLRYWGGTYGLSGADLDRRIREVLELTELQDRAKEPVKKFSGGMKRRLNFAAGIVHEPDVLLLDEPTVGVDPQSRVKLLDLVRQHAGSGKCVLYTTHYMEEAEQLCDQLAVIDHGKLIAHGTLEELRGQTEEADVIRLTGSFPSGDFPSTIVAMDGFSSVRAEEGLLMFSVRDATRHLPRILETLTTSGAEIRETTLTRPSLESLFIKLTGEGLRE